VLLVLKCRCSSGRTKKFEFFHWLTQDEWAAEIKVTSSMHSLLLPARMAALLAGALYEEKEQNKWRPFPTDPKESKKSPRNQSSISPEMFSILIAIIAFCCSRQEGEKKRLSL